jgi:hypothetical protein
LKKVWRISAQVRPISSSWDGLVSAWFSPAASQERNHPIRRCCLLELILTERWLRISILNGIVTQTVSSILIQLKIIHRTSEVEEK